jgi:hypothetical protein
VKCRTIYVNTFQLAIDLMDNLAKIRSEGTYC